TRPRSRREAGVLNAGARPFVDEGASEGSVGVAGHARIRRWRSCSSPGFTQTATAWDAVVDHLPADAGPVPVDVPTSLGFVETAAAIGELGGRAVYVGYSMGGRLCLRLALDPPALVRGLVLPIAVPGLAN